MDMLERVRDCYAKGMRYQETARELGLDKNKIYKATKDLVEAGCIEGVENDKGKYDVIAGVPLPAAGRPRRYRKRQVVAPAPVVAVVEPIVERVTVPVESLDTLATRLLGRIGELQPLLILMLRKDLFDEIQSLVLQLVDQLNQAQPRTLTEPEFGEWRELKVIKQQAQAHAERHK